jgi:hypothetical protein
MTNAIAIDFALVGLRLSTRTSSPANPYWSAWGILVWTPDNAEDHMTHVMCHRI